MKASGMFGQCLEEEGVEYVFGVSGEENLDLIESRRSRRRALRVAGRQAAA